MQNIGMHTIGEKYGKYTFVGVLVLMLFGAGNRVLSVYTVGYVGANNITMRVSYR